ncbi:MAG: hypothetical protein M3198_06870 [Actinomycetota bacterium]|nr:hypothetical protein [Actinomycetota bacterium]
MAGDHQPASLVVFNLMPAALSTVAAHCGRSCASLTATAVGSWLLVGLGLLQVVIGAGYGGLWLVLLGGQG